MRERARGHLARNGGSGARKAKLGHHWYAVVADETERLTYTPVAHNLPGPLMPADAPNNVTSWSKHVYSSSALQPNGRDDHHSQLLLSGKRAASNASHAKEPPKRHCGLGNAAKETTLADTVRAPSRERGAPRASHMQRAARVEAPNTRPACASPPS